MAGVPLFWAGLGGAASGLAGGLQSMQALRLAQQRQKSEDTYRSALLALEQAREAREGKQFETTQESHTTDEAQRRLDAQLAEAMRGLQEQGATVTDPGALRSAIASRGAPSTAGAYPGGGGMPIPIPDVGPQVRAQGKGAIGKLKPGTSAAISGQIPAIVHRKPEPQVTAAQVRSTHGIQPIDREIADLTREGHLLERGTSNAFRKMGIPITSADSTAAPRLTQIHTRLAALNQQKAGGAGAPGAGVLGPPTQANTVADQGEYDALRTSMRHSDIVSRYHLAPGIVPKPDDEQDDQQQ
jgi:hypothetical protein